MPEGDGSRLMTRFEEEDEGQAQDLGPDADPGTRVEPYDSLASIYDHVMRHVDYEHWARYVDDLLREIAGAPRELIELACGTGNATFTLADLSYSIRGYDGCEAMIRVAREKSSEDGRGIPFDVRDLRDLHDVAPTQAVICLYDSMNYLLEAADIDTALQQVHGVLTTGGVFIFDVCTEQNSVVHFDGIVDIENGPGFHYTRRSDYHRGERLQVNSFDIEFEDGRRHQETHVQHIYPIDELRDRIEASPMRLRSAFDGFTKRKGSERSDRVHFVLQRDD